MNWYIIALKKYATFTGRAQRSEYWYFILFNYLIALVLALIDSMTGTFNMMSGYGLLMGLFSLAMFIPITAVGVRRLHDTDRSGWWMLLELIPFIGSIVLIKYAVADVKVAMLLPIIGFVVLITFLVQDSQASENRFGANPKAAG